MNVFGEVLLRHNYHINEDPSYGKFYHKCIEENYVRRYFIEIHEYNFSKFKDTGYEGEDYRYDVRLAFNQKDGGYLEVRYGIHDFNYRDELLKQIEAKCERLFTVNDGVNYEEFARSGFE